ncbi:hypothetical protein MMAN_06520 [Mycobacterium mantenii]|uniref:Uncharacterized protein n=2 Tax=Mycobacterium mantenii TaxID=560555 RepID=A0A1X0FXN0_MYCNT|nr:hypothetical protein BST30_10300 [Mycobacterium mantenii]BBY36518.1 hypothetical protein MMAN_06520 [Mycobacterium mantenii]
MFERRFVLNATAAPTLDGMDLEKLVLDYVHENMPTDLQVPTGGSEEEAMQVVKKQFSDAGAFECSDGLARKIVQHARAKADDK